MKLSKFRGWGFWNDSVQESINKHSRKYAKAAHPFDPFGDPPYIVAIKDMMPYSELDASRNGYTSVVIVHEDGATLEVGFCREGASMAVYTISREAGEAITESLLDLP